MQLKPLLIFYASTSNLTFWFFFISLWAGAGLFLRLLNRCILKLFIRKVFMDFHVNGLKDLLINPKSNLKKPFVHNFYVLIQTKHLICIGMYISSTFLDHFSQFSKWIKVTHIFPNVALNFLVDIFSINGFIIWTYIIFIDFGSLLSFSLTGKNACQKRSTFLNLRARSGFFIRSGRF